MRRILLPPFEIICFKKNALLLGANFIFWHGWNHSEKNLTNFDDIIDTINRNWCDDFIARLFCLVCVSNQFIHLRSFIIRSKSCFWCKDCMNSINNWSIYRVYTIIYGSSYFMLIIFGNTTQLTHRHIHILYCSRCCAERHEVGTNVVCAVDVANCTSVW